MKLGPIIWACERLIPKISPRPTVLSPGFNFSNAITVILLICLSALRVALADCECGYSSSSHYDPVVYTELLESDFLHIRNISLDSDWIPQHYNVSAGAARGGYGETRQLANVVENPILDKYSYSGRSLFGADPGLQLYVRKFEPESHQQLVGTAEIVTKRNDILYGSFRVAMKLTGVSGTCGAFFWYFNDTQEIDIEFLSRQFNSSSSSSSSLSSPVNLVLQSPDSARAGFDASHTPTFRIYSLPFSPDTNYHEYRFDWTPDRVAFYADGQFLWSTDSSSANMHTTDSHIKDAIPTQPGRLILSHWSNGNPSWSGGPPTSLDAVMTVSYVKAYFNSSLANRHADYTRRCKGPAAPKAICPIPNQEVPPSPLGHQGNRTANTFFFTHQANMSANQTVYVPQKSAGGTLKSKLKAKAKAKAKAESIWAKGWLFGPVLVELGICGFAAWWLGVVCLWQAVIA